MKRPVNVSSHWSFLSDKKLITDKLKKDIFQ